MFRKMGVLDEQVLTYTEELLEKITFQQHKGQTGRLCVIGGSPDYTGAPYFAGTAALRLGVSLVDVICPPSASLHIKAIAPDLMVHPVLPTSANPDLDMSSWVAKATCIVVGPGLGRDPVTLKAVNELLRAVAGKIPCVVDAEALEAVPVDEEPEAGDILGYSSLRILTPNTKELERLKKRLNVTCATQVAGKTHSVVLQKGQYDTIHTRSGTFSTSPETAWTPKRCGGQGDVLAGLVGACAAMLEGRTRTRKAAIVGSVATRLTASATFKEKGWSMITSDMLNHCTAILDIEVKNEEAQK